MWIWLVRSQGTPRYQISQDSLFAAALCTAFSSSSCFFFSCLFFSSFIFLTSLAVSLWSAAYLSFMNCLYSAISSFVLGGARFHWGMGMGVSQSLWSSSLQVCLYKPFHHQSNHWSAFLLWNNKTEQERAHTWSSASDASLMLASLWPIPCFTFVHMVRNPHQAQISQQQAGV